MHVVFGFEFIECLPWSTSVQGLLGLGLGDAPTAPQAVAIAHLQAFSNLQVWTFCLVLVVYSAGLSLNATAVVARDYSCADPKRRTLAPWYVAGGAAVSTSHHLPPVVTQLPLAEGDKIALEGVGRAWARVPKPGHACTSVHKVGGCCSQAG